MAVCGYLVVKEHHQMADSPNCESGQYTLWVLLLYMYLLSFVLFIIIQVELIPF